MVGGRVMSYCFDIGSVKTSEFSYVIKHGNSMYTIENLILNSDLRSESINTIFYYTDPIISCTGNINVTSRSFIFYVRRKIPLAYIWEAR
jgi:hypothetical protein